MNGNKQLFLYFIKIWRKGTLVNDKGYPTKAAMKNGLAAHQAIYGNNPMYRYLVGRRIFNSNEFIDEI